MQCARRPVLRWDRGPHVQHRALAGGDGQFRRAAEGRKAGPSDRLRERIASVFDQRRRVVVITRHRHSIQDAVVRAEIGDVELVHKMCLPVGAERRRRLRDSNIDRRGENRPVGFGLLLRDSSSRSIQDLARPRASVTAVIDHDLAVDEHLVDAFG